MTRQETVESCCSEDLVTVMEAKKKKPFKVTDRLRFHRKGIMASSLEQLIVKCKHL